MISKKQIISKSKNFFAWTVAATLTTVALHSWSGKDRIRLVEEETYPAKAHISKMYQEAAATLDGSTWEKARTAIEQKIDANNVCILNARGESTTVVRGNSSFVETPYDVKKMQECLSQAPEAKPPSLEQMIKDAKNEISSRRYWAVCAGISAYFTGAIYSLACILRRIHNRRIKATAPVVGG